MTQNCKKWNWHIRYAMNYQSVLYYIMHRSVRRSKDFLGSKPLFTKACTHVDHKLSVIFGRFLRYHSIWKWNIYSTVTETQSCTLCDSSICRFLELLPLLCFQDYRNVQHCNRTGILSALMIGTFFKALTSKKVYRQF